MGALFGKIGHAIGKVVGSIAGFLGLGTPEITVVVPSTTPVTAPIAKDYTPYILLGIAAFVVVTMIKK